MADPRSVAVVAEWPAHTQEPRPWTTNPDARDSSGRRPPYEDRTLEEIMVSIPPSIADITPRLSPSTTIAVEEAAAAIVTLDEGIGARLGALSGFLLRSESIATSKIERIYANLDDFARALAGQHAGEEARQTAAAVAAIGSLVDRAETSPLTVEVIDEAHRRLLADDPTEGHYAGTHRPMQNWIGGNDFSPRLAEYVPPPRELVGALMGDLEAAANHTDVPVLSQAAIVHAQFESIHPYTDGNGRIGRALINVVLRRRRLTRRLVVPIASVMLADVDEYFARLDAYRGGDADGFVRYTANAATLASDEATTSALALAELPGRWRGAVHARGGSATDKLLDRLLDTPVLTDKTAAAAAGSSVRRIYDALERLAEGRILTEVTGKERDRVWVVADVLDELDRLEQRIGRRKRGAG
ncbi:MAG: Fic family protein [Acidimicrobiia bacterium]